ncbi:MAG: hypothetical protein CSB34_03860 [Desulfobulbus propionicus]|nr:MAG: hypothetical protein CSB34_03860 [Desulfobulbus propionicus]
MKILQHAFTTENQFLKDLHNTQIPLNDPHILVQIFTGNQNIRYIQNVLELIRTVIPQCIIIGTTTDGGILNNQILEESLLVSILYFEKTTLQIEKSDDPSYNSFEKGVHLGRKLQKPDLKAVILFGEGLSVNGEELLTGLESQVGDIVVAGGLAADNYSFAQTHIVYQEEILDKGAVAVGLYSDTLRVKARSAFDCDVLDEEFVITESQGNIVKKINDVPPAVLYSEQLGLHTDNKLLEICAQIPMVVNRNGEILARSVVKRYSDGVLGFAGNLMEGEKARFGIANVDKMLRNGSKIFNGICSQWDAVFIFSCAGRKSILSDKLTQDIQDFPQIAPVNGFFSFGEFIKEKGARARFCNLTMVLLFLSESENVPCSSGKKLRQQEDKVSPEPPASIRKNQKEQDIIHEVLQNQIRLIGHKNKIREQLDRVEYRNKIMEEMLYKDSLTGLRNRTSLLQEIEEKNPRGIMLIDIRNFHAINDLYGESVGNLILQSFAAFLKNTIEPVNIFRLSGNTFALLNISEQAQEKCLSLAQKIVQNIEAKNFSFITRGTTLQCAISVTIGISNEKNGRNQLEHADMALNYAKKHHKSFVIYSEKLNIKQQYEHDIEIVKMVKDALESDRVIPFFQPVFEGETVSYYEALVRIKTKDNRTLTPFHFLDVIKHTTYYSYLTRRVIKKSFEIFQKLDSMVAINLSFFDLANTKTVEYLLEMIKEYDMGEKLILEILESEVFQDYATTIQQIKRFRTLGVRIAVDDFGSGYSNFLHLTRINPDYIKIDGSLIKDIDTEIKSLAICKAIISFARDLKIKTIAEFIHSKEILQITTSLKVDKHQGFYLGKPQKAEELFPGISLS